MGRFPAAVTMAVLLTGCVASQARDPAPFPADKPDSWHCRNDLEIRCGEGVCTAEADDGFTPMSVSIDASGGLSVCAYSGCWEGSGEVKRDGSFLVVTGRDLAFSTAPGVASAREDVLVAVDLTDSVAILKAGEFAHPLSCERRSAEP